MQQDSLYSLIQFIPMLLLTVPFAFAAGWLAPKFGARRWLWVCLCLVPLVNLVCYPIFLCRVAGAVLDRLNQLNDKIK